MLRLACLVTAMLLAALLHPAAAGPLMGTLKQGTVSYAVNAGLNFEQVKVLARDASSYPCKTSSVRMSVYSYDSGSRKSAVNVEVANDNFCVENGYHQYWAGYINTTSFGVIRNAASLKVKGPLVKLYSRGIKTPPQTIDVDFAAVCSTNFETYTYEYVVPGVYRTRETRTYCSPALPVTGRVNIDGLAMDMCQASFGTSTYKSSGNFPFTGCYQ